MAESAAAEVRAADATPIASHPIRKFKHALLAVVHFWPFWLFIAIAVILGAVVERAGRGAVTGVVPFLGAWARERAVSAPVTTAAVAASTAADQSGMPPY